VECRLSSPHVATEYRNLSHQFISPTCKLFVLSHKVRRHEHRRIVILTSVWWHQENRRPATRPAEGWRVGRWEMGTSLPLTRAARTGSRPWKCARKPGSAENLWHSFLYPSKQQLSLDMKLYFVFFWRKFARGYCGIMRICVCLFLILRVTSISNGLD